MLGALLWMERREQGDCHILGNLSREWRPDSERPGNVGLEQSLPALGANRLPRMLLHWFPRCPSAPCPGQSGRASIEGEKEHSRQPPPSAVTAWPPVLNLRSFLTTPSPLHEFQALIHFCLLSGKGWVLCRRKERQVDGAFGLNNPA